MENVTISADRNLVDFRFPVQYVGRPHQDFHGSAGQIVSGTIKVGEEVVALSSMQRWKVAFIDFCKVDLEEAAKGQSVMITLDNEIDIFCFDVMVRRHDIPELEQEVEATSCSMDDRQNLSAITNYILQHTTQTTQAYVDEILYELNINTLHCRSADTLKLNEIGRVNVTAAWSLFFDPYDRNRQTGGFVLIDPNDHRTVGAGMIRYSSRSTISQPQAISAPSASRPPPRRTAILSGTPAWWARRTASKKRPQAHVRLVHPSLRKRQRHHCQEPAEEAVRRGQERVSL